MWMATVSQVVTSEASVGDECSVSYNLSLLFSVAAFTERFPKLLLSGSLVFKSTKFTEWFSERLEPFVDYIPVSYDQHDLESQVEYMHAHQSLAKSIAEHGKETAERHLRPQDQLCYTYRLMLEYHSLFEETA